MGRRVGFAALAAPATAGRCVLRLTIVAVIVVGRCSHRIPLCHSQTSSRPNDTESRDLHAAVAAPIVDMRRTTTATAINSTSKTRDSWHVPRMDWVRGYEEPDPGGYDEPFCRNAHALTFRP